MKNKTALPYVYIFIILLSLQSLSFGKVHYLKIPSLALTDSNRVILATPSSFDIKRISGYPFIVMLHGYGGDQSQWESDADLQKISDSHNILLVLPDGGHDGWWIDTDLSPGRDYDTHLHQEIKIWVVENFNGSKDADQHGIMGLSMGGYGAFMQALKHPESYGAAVSLSGVMDITRHPDSWGIVKALGSYSENVAGWESQNPLHLSQNKVGRAGPDLLLICGRDDFAFEENQAIAHLMANTGYSANLREEAGAHSHTFWKTHVESAIEFIVNKFPQ